MFDFDAVVDEIKERVMAARRVLVVGHVRPDGDALGSVTAVGGMLEQFGTEYVLAVDDGMVERFEYLPLSDKVMDGARVWDEFDLVIAVDSSDDERLGEAYERVRAERLPVINIDHHPTNTMYGVVNVVPSTMPSACEVLYRLFGAMGVEITAGIAQSLLTGVVTDTLGFRTPNVTPETMRCAGALMAAGADLPFITMQTLNLTRFNSVEIWALMLGNMKFEEGFVWATASYQERQQIGAGTNGSNGLSSLLGNVEEAVMGATMSEVEPGVVRVSLRSRPPFDVSGIALELGGGGHRQAAGCTIRDSIEGAEKLLVGVAKKAIREQVGVINE